MEEESQIILEIPRTTQKMAVKWIYQRIHFSHEYHFMSFCFSYASRMEVATSMIKLFLIFL